MAIRIKFVKLLANIRSLVQRPPKPGQTVIIGSVPFRYLGMKYDKSERRYVKVYRCRICFKDVEDIYGHIRHERLERAAYLQEMQAMREIYGIQASGVKP